MYYKYRYVDNIDVNVISILDKYDIDMHKSIYLYFIKVQNGDIVNIDTLKRSWGRLWLGNKTIYDIMYQEPSSWRNTKNEKRKKGIESIVHIYNYYSKNIGCPIVINKKYKIKINKAITLTGNFEIIRELNDNIEIIHFKTGDKLHDSFCVNNDLELTAASYAFRKLFGTKENAIIYHGIDKHKIKTTTRNENSYKILLNTIVNVCKCIYNNIFYICPEEDKCYNCVYKNHCIKNTM